MRNGSFIPLHSDGSCAILLVAGTHDDPPCCQARLAIRKQHTLTFAFKLLAEKVVFWLHNLRDLILLEESLAHEA